MTVPDLAPVAPLEQQAEETLRTTAEARRERVRANMAADFGD